MNITKLSVDRPVATVMVFLIILVLGFAGFRFLPVDLLPPIEYPRLSVSVSYPNAGPEEVETIITDQLENALSGVANLERMTSNSSEGNSWVSLNFSRNTNMDEAANDVRAALDRVRRSLPEEADAPRVRKFDPNDSPIVVLGAESFRPLDELTRILERDISKRIEQVSGVGAIDVWGGVYREIRVDLKRDRLIATGLTALDVRNALVSENSTLPGGDVKDGLSQLYIRTLGEFTSMDQISETIIRTVDGKPIRVKDVAEVRDDYQEIGRLVWINNTPMVRLGIRKQTGANTVAVSEGIQKEIDRINLERDDLKLTVVTDQSTFIQNSIDNVQQSAVWGALLAIFILYLFLRNGSTTFIISLAIPVSLIATFGLLYFNGLTLNQMSFGGLALGIGLIVDNAIVVLENIVRQRNRGESLRNSSLTGTREVRGAIIASTLTTSVIFIPVVFMQTVTGSLFQQLALVVVFSLFCSLFVALSLVPMLASKIMTVRPFHRGDGSAIAGDRGLAEENPTPEGNKRARPLRLAGVQRFLAAMENWYADVLERAIGRKGLIYGATLVLVLISAYGATWIPAELAPQTEADEVEIEFNLSQGMNIAASYEYLKELEAKVIDLIPKDEIQFFTSDVRGGEAEIEIAMKEQGERTMSTYELADQMRDQIEGTIPGGEFRVRAQTGLWILRRIFGGGGDDAIQMELRGYDLNLADQLADDIVARMERIPGVRGAQSGRREGRPEQNIIFDREKIAALGLTARDVAQAIQSNVGGVRAGVFRDGGDEYDITVRLREADRFSTLDIENISVRSATGDVIPLSSVIRQEPSRGPTSIGRVNGQRYTTISANLEEGVTLSEAVEAIRAELSTMVLPDGFSIVYGGEYEEQQKAQRDFLVSIVLAIVLIYMVMAAQFERLIDPLIVMFSVPVAMIGVVPMLLATGTSFNMQSIMGLMMLIGIVVNNAIVLVDYINLMRREKGMPVYEAVVESARRRLRPILMTTLTTVLALLPLSFGLGAGGEIQASLARVVIGGLAASTLVTLLLIPVVYLSIDRIRVTVRERRELRERNAGELISPDFGFEGSATSK